MSETNVPEVVETETKSIVDQQAAMIEDLKQIIHDFEIRSAKYDADFAALERDKLSAESKAKHLESILVELKNINATLRGKFEEDLKMIDSTVGFDQSRTGTKVELSYEAFARMTRLMKAAEADRDANIQIIVETLKTFEFAPMYDIDGPMLPGRVKEQVEAREKAQQSLEAMKKIAESALQGYMASISNLKLVADNLNGIKNRELELQTKLHALQSNGAKALVNAAHRLEDISIASIIQRFKNVFRKPKDLHSDIYESSSRLRQEVGDILEYIGSYRKQIDTVMRTLDNIATCTNRSVNHLQNQKKAIVYKAPARNDDFFDQIESEPV